MSAQLTPGVTIIFIYSFIYCKEDKIYIYIRQRNNNNIVKATFSGPRRPQEHWHATFFPEKEMYFVPKDTKGKLSQNPFPFPACDVISVPRKPSLGGSKGMVLLAFCFAFPRSRHTHAGMSRAVLLKSGIFGFRRDVRTFGLRSVGVFGCIFCLSWLILMIYWWQGWW